MQKEQELDQQIEASFNQLPMSIQQTKDIDFSQHKYLTPSETNKVGFFGSKSQFDLRFNEIKNSMVTSGLLSVLTTFYPAVNKYLRDHPETKREPQKCDKQQLQRQLKMQQPDFSIPKDGYIKYTWIGHSTAVIQIGQDNLIIDPVFSDRASPYQFVGPKRFRPPACQIKELPHINLVLISHDHYDHLDQHALKQLNHHFHPMFVAGKGSRDVLPKKSKDLLMDWMDTHPVKINDREYKITFVPVCHWSKRGLNDFNTRLWGGFIIQTPNKQKIFYSGDTGYCGVFKQIGQRYGPFDLCILPIGAYQPRQVLKPQHVNPYEAVLLHKQLRSHQSVGVHWGTFPLGAEGYFQAKYDLQKAKDQLGVKKEEFITICHGQSINFLTNKHLKK